MTKLRELHHEYNELREKIFNGQPFAEVQDNDDNKRYQQLLMLFHPEFRTKQWINPAPEISIQYK